MKKIILYLVTITLAAVVSCMAATGDTQICKWKSCKIAAFSIGGDDSLRSQTTFAIPLMTQRGIYGTWWVNTGRGHNELGFDFIDDEAYWVAAVKAGHDLANHTLHHTGARDAADAEWEIGENARRIWAIQPDTKLLLFERGGGTVWDASEEQIKELLKKYHCIDGRGAAGVDSPAWLINHSASELRSFVDAAIKEGSYHYIIFHGVGPNAEWGGQTNGDAFLALLDYLVEKRDLVWSETLTKIYKYAEERDHSHAATEEVSDSRIRIRFSSELDTTTGMFDYPVTLRTEVPPDWKTCTVQQANHSAIYSVEEGVVQYSALPNASEIRIMRGGAFVPDPPSNTGLSSPPPSPPVPPLLPMRALEEFNYSSDSELNHGWWILPCGNETTVSLLPAGSGGAQAMSFVYASGDKGRSGRVHRNTSLDLSPYKYLSLKFKPSNTSDTITFQFMEAIQNEFWETSFKPKGTARQTIVIPLTKEFFHHPIWFKGSDADGVIDLSNVKLISLFVSSNGAGSVVFDAIEASKEVPLYADFSTPVTAVTPALTETGRCRVAK